jgi:putative ABC transport system ATP-binding protein
MINSPVATNDVAIQALGLNKSFGKGDTRIEVLHNISITLYAGELTLLMGPSGSGKSTLLALMSGLLKPDAGDVEVFSKNLWHLSTEEIEHFRLTYCGFIFQGFNLFSALTAQEQVELVLQYGEIPDEQAQQHAREALTAVDLGNRMHLRPSELSGGEKQRVAIARALAKKPKLIFADEPTSSLDKTNGETVVRLLKQAAHERDAAILCVTHDTRLLKYADRVLRIDDGKITGDQRPNESGEFNDIQD